MKKLIVIIIVAVVVVACLAAVLIMSLGPASGFAKGSLVAPEVEYVEWPAGVAPTPSTNTPQSTDWVITGKAAEDSIYSGFGGAMWFFVTNSGSRNMYVYGIGLSWVGTNVSYHRDAGVLVPAGETGEIGLLPIGAPVEPGSRAYELDMDYAVQQLVGAAWYDHGSVRTTSDTLDVQDAAAMRSWSTERNPTGYYNDVNSRIDTESVESVVSGIQANRTGAYSILQVCDAYEWVRRNIVYVLDDGDNWQNAQETMQLRTGDCEDSAILLSSMLKGLGGFARLDIIKGHAFSTVFVGNNESALVEMEGAIASYYRVSPDYLRVNYLIDDMGYWMIVDTLGVTYVGGLPAESSYARTDGGQGTWTFLESDYLITIDVTGQTSKFLGLF